MEIGNLHSSCLWFIDSTKVGIFSYLLAVMYRYCTEQEYLQSCILWFIVGTEVWIFSVLYPIVYRWCTE